MFNVGDTAPDTPAPRELNQNIQALINNGLDLLDKAREELEASKPKLSVAGFWTVVEILLKVSLVHKHWSLVCSPERPVKEQAYLAGDFQSVTYGETRERLKDVFEKPLDREMNSTSGKVRKCRNHIVHFYHPTFTEAEQRQIPKEQADVWFTLNRLLGDGWKAIFGVKHNWELVFGETRLIGGNKFYAEIRFKQIKPELEQLPEKDIQVDNYNECHQHTTITGIGTTDNENRRLEATQCKVCISAVRQITLVCPDYEMPQLLPEGGNNFECEHCDYILGRCRLLDEELFHSVDEQLLSVFPVGCTDCMIPESIRKFGDGYLYTQCFIYYTELHVCGCCGRLNDNVPEPDHIRGCELCDDDQRYFDD